MKSNINVVSGLLVATPVIISSGLLLLAGAGRLPADQVELRTGDRYVGQVLSIDTNSVVLQSGVLGRVRLPRSKVTLITLGQRAATNSPAVPLKTNAEPPTLSGAGANAALKGPLALKGMKVNTNVVQQVQRQLLDGAGDEVNAKFNELLGGLLTGKLDVDNIRAQAKAAADQLRALQRGSGEETAFATSTYLAILDQFLKETAPPSAVTNAIASQPKSKPKAAPEEE